MNNKGFSLVELIIVIAIMAILSGALAPQLMKYIQRSRTSVDYNACQGVITSINTTLANDEPYREIITSAINNSNVITFSFNGSKPTDYSDASIAGGEFEKSLLEDLGSWPSTKAESADAFYCKITVDLTDNTIENVEVQTEPFTP